MPKTVEIPEQNAIVEFPDDMSAEQIDAAIKTEFYIKPALKASNAAVDATFKAISTIASPGVGMAAEDVRTVRAKKEALPEQIRRAQAARYTPSVTEQRELESFAAGRGKPESGMEAGKTLTTELATSGVSDPIATVLNSAKAWGKLISGAGADVLQGVRERGVTQTPSVLMDVLGGTTPNVQAALTEPTQQPLPVQQELATAPGTRAAVAKGLLGTVESLPTLATGMVVSRIAPQYAPMIFGGLFGYQAGVEGGTPEDVAKATLTGMVIPGTMTIGAEAGSQLAARAGVLSNTAQKALELTGQQVALNAITHLAALPQYVAATPDERKRMAVEMTASNLAFLFMDAGKISPKVSSLVQSNPELMTRLAEKSLDKAMQTPQYKEALDRSLEGAGTYLQYGRTPKATPPAGTVQADLSARQIIENTKQVAPLTAKALEQTLSPTATLPLAEVEAKGPAPADATAETPATTPKTGALTSETKGTTDARDEQKAVQVSGDTSPRPPAQVAEGGTTEVQKPAEPQGKEEAQVSTESPELIQSAAVGSPIVSEPMQGPNHPAILRTAGVPGFESRESRNVPGFGFWTNKGRFVTREEAAEIAKKQGQDLAPFEISESTGEPAAHSNEVQAPGAAAGTPISESAVKPEAKEPSAPPVSPAAEAKPAEPTWMDKPLSYWKSVAVPQKLGASEWRANLAKVLGVKNTPAQVAKGIQGKIRDMEAELAREQRKIDNAAADKFDAEQLALIEKIEKGETVSQADVDRLLQPDSDWAKRAKISEPKPAASPGFGEPEKPTLEEARLTWKATNLGRSWKVEVPGRAKPVYVSSVLGKDRPNIMGAQEAIDSAYKSVYGELTEANVAKATTPTTAQAAAKVETEVQKVAATEGKKSAKDVKKELVSRIEQEIADLPKPDENLNIQQVGPRTMRGKKEIEFAAFPGDRITIRQSGTGYDVYASDYYNPPNSKQPITIIQYLARGVDLKSAKALAQKTLRENGGNYPWRTDQPIFEGSGFGKEIKVNWEYFGGKAGKQKTVTIDIPGDGTFTIPKTRYSLEEMLKRVKALDTRPQVDVPTAMAGPDKDLEVVKGAKQAEDYYKSPIKAAATIRRQLRQGEFTPEQVRFSEDIADRLENQAQERIQDLRLKVQNTERSLSSGWQAIKELNEYPKKYGPLTPSQSRALAEYEKRVKEDAKNLEEYRKQLNQLTTEKEGYYENDWRPKVTEATAAATPDEAVAPAAKGETKESTYTGENVIGGNAKPGDRIEVRWERWIGEGIVEKVENGDMTVRVETDNQKGKFSRVGKTIVVPADVGKRLANIAEPKPPEPTAEGGITQGPGGKTREAREEAPESYEGTALKNAVGELERAGFGLKDAPPTQRRVIAETWIKSQALFEEATRRGEQNPGDVLVQELKANPRRGMTDTDSAVLLRHKTNILNQLNDTAEKSWGEKDPDVKASLEQRTRLLTAQFEEILDVSKERGTQWGREGKWRQVIAKQDYSLDAVVRRLRIARGGKPFTAEEMLGLQKQVKEAQEAQAKAEELEKLSQQQLAEERAAKETALWQLEEARKPRYAPEIIKIAESIVGKFVSAREAALARIQERRKAGKELYTLKYSPKDFADDIIVGASLFAEGIGRGAIWTARMIELLGEKVTPYLENILPDSEKYFEENLKPYSDEVQKVVRRRARTPKEPTEVGKTPTELPEPTGEESDVINNALAKIQAKVANNDFDIYSQVQRIGRELTAQGLRGWRPLADAIHPLLKSVIPEIDFRETLDAMSGYGRFSPLSKDAVDVAWREARAQSRKVRQIQDVIRKEALKRTGLEYPTPSDVERRYEAIFNEMKRRFGVVVDDPATQLRSVLQARKTYYENRLADLRYEISTQKRIVRTKTAPPTDAELEALQAEYRQVKAERDAVFADNITEEQRIQRALASAERNQSAWEQRLENAKRGVFDRDTGKKRPATSPEIEAVRTRTEAIRQEVEALRDANEAYRQKREADQLQRQIAEYDRKLAAGEFFSSEKPDRPTSPENEALRQRRDMARAALKAARDASPEMMRRALERAEAYGEELQRRINEGDIAAKAAGTKPVPAELAAQRAENAELQKILNQLRNASKPKKTPQERALQSYMTRLASREAELTERIAKRDFTKKVKQETVLTKEAQEAKRRVQKLQDRFDAMELAERMKARYWWEKGFDVAAKFRRFGVLSSPIVFPKLISAGIQRMVSLPLEDLIGDVYRRLPGSSTVARYAPLEGGGFSANKEIRGYTALVTQGMKDAADVVRTGKSELDIVYGHRKDPTYTGESNLGSAWLEYPGRLHGMVKAPVKRANFERALVRLNDFYSRQIDPATGQRYDITDPAMMMRIGTEAYKAANRSIFLQDNFVASKINGFISEHAAGGHSTVGRKAWATTGRVLLPIIRVPTNIVAETAQYAFGLGIGGTRLLGLKVGEVLRKTDSIEYLKKNPEYADLIMRELKKGTIGGAALLIGYFFADSFGGFYDKTKKKDKDEVPPMSFRIDGVTIPPWLMHNPLLETLQLGATIRKVQDSFLRKHDTETQGLGNGMLAAAWGLTEEIPFVREMAEIEKFGNPYTRQPWLQAQAASYVVPAAVSWAATKGSIIGLGDKDAEGNVIRRQPRGYVEAIKAQIPGLRQQVPEATEKRTGRRF